MHANATLRQYLANSNAHFENSPRILILILARAIRKIYTRARNTKTVVITQNVYYICCIIISEWKLAFAV